MAYRYWCGECGFRTGWLTESQVERQQTEHYAARHPEIFPGGQVETDRRNPNRAVGCAQLVGLLVMVLILAASCRR
ncbi:hypothetical protein OHV05_31920 [Kitasatospora sp. NBC_00070]|uniref:hypothetical protein n=1 Tax=Kitasatospora sp. NBC_00070 TaxID=2975962 RepID=UPI0032453444